jgi:hypothetical protein
MAGLFHEQKSVPHHHKVAPTIPPVEQLATDGIKSASLMLALPVLWTGRLFWRRFTWGEGLMKIGYNALALGFESGVPLHLYSPKPDYPFLLRS